MNFMMAGLVCFAFCVLLHPGSRLEEVVIDLIFDAGLKLRVNYSSGFSPGWLRAQITCLRDMDVSASTLHMYSTVLLTVDDEDYATGT